MTQWTNHQHSWASALHAEGKGYESAIQHCNSYWNHWRVIQLYVAVAIEIVLPHAQGVKQSIQSLLLLINPWHMRKRCSHKLCINSVCEYVCYHASCHIPDLYIENEVPLGFLWYLYVDFVKSTLFKSSGDICWPPQRFSFLDKLSVDEKDSDHFISILVAFSSSDSSYNLTVVTVGYQQCFLALPCTRSADLACTWHLHAIVLVYSCGYFLATTLLTVTVLQICNM